MGLRGKQPTPTPILAARGSWIAAARVKAGEPQLPVEAPDCPEWLSDEAKQVWFQLVPMLVDMRVLARIDAGAITRYCDAFVQWRKAADFLNASKTLVYAVKDKGGDTVAWAAWPQNTLYDKFNKILVSLEYGFGLTPAARSRLISQQARPQAESTTILKLLPHRAG